MESVIVVRTVPIEARGDEFEGLALETERVARADRGEPAQPVEVDPEKWDARRRARVYEKPHR